MIPFIVNQNSDRYLVLGYDLKQGKYLLAHKESGNMQAVGIDALAESYRFDGLVTPDIVQRFSEPVDLFPHMERGRLGFRLPNTSVEK